jgi:AraC family transcriptional regulator
MVGHQPNLSKEPVMDGGDGRWEWSPESVALSATLFKLIAEATEVLDDDRKAARILLERAASLLRCGAPGRPLNDLGARRRAVLAPWQAKRVAAYIEANLDRPLPLAELAGIAKLSSSYFSRAFKGAFGKTPHTFIIGRRVDRARQEILESGEPLARIAVSCGFADQAHLARLFRRVTGLAPSEWRRVSQPAVNQSRHQALV